MKKLTLAEWFFKLSGTTWAEYVRKFNNGDYINAVSPNEVKMIWNAGARNGKVAK